MSPLINDIYSKVCTHTWEIILQQHYDTQQLFRLRHTQVIPDALDLVELNSNKAYGQVRISFVIVYC